LPIPALIQPLEVPAGVLDRDIWVMLIATVVLIGFCYGIKRFRYKITRIEGAILFAGFIAYQAILYFQTVR